jgi:preprotein translocase subunit YajC
MPPRDQGLWQTLSMVAMALLFFYFILWRPEQKRKKAMEEQRSSLKKGDKVTAVGIVGTVVKVQDQTVILRMVDGSKIEVLKMAINEVIPSDEESSKEIKEVTSDKDS